MLLTTFTQIWQYLHHQNTRFTCCLYRLAYLYVCALSGYSGCHVFLERQRFWPVSSCAGFRCIEIDLKIQSQPRVDQSADVSRGLDDQNSRAGLLFVRPLLSCFSSGSQRVLCIVRQ